MEFERNLIDEFDFGVATTRQERLQRLCRATGYKIIQKNGQRIFQAEKQLGYPIPERGSEVFVSKLAPYILEDELVPIFASIGPIYNTRLMLDFNGNSRGYGFVRYYYRKHAYEAIRMLDKVKIAPGDNQIVVNKSVDNRTLFLGHVPQTMSKQEVYDKLCDKLEGIKDVIMYSSREEPGKNRGYAFVEFTTHEDASKSRKLLQYNRIDVLGSSLTVDWADPEPDIHPKLLPQVKKLFIRNIDMKLSYQQILANIRRYVPLEHIVKVYTKFDYGFIHFATKEYAEKALNCLQGKTFGANQIQVEWARPKTYSKPLPPPSYNYKSVSTRMRKEMVILKEAQRKFATPELRYVSNSFDFFS